MSRLVRMVLETEGCEVVTAETLSRAREVPWDDLDGIVLDRQLPDGDGADLLAPLAERRPEARVVVHSTIDDDRRPPQTPRVDKGDVMGLLDALGIHEGRPQPAPVLAATRILHDGAAGIEAEWRELCQWDPMLPPDSRPVVPPGFLSGLAVALERPQPLGWGADPAIEVAAEAFADDAPSVDEAIEQLVCLREALVRRVLVRVPPDEQSETSSRMHMLIDRCIGVAAQRQTMRLRAEALTDPLTGLANRRALERDLRRELTRSARHRRSFTVVVIDVDGLKAVNDREGHPAGDRLLRRVADAMLRTLRATDTVYRIGGDEFSMLLPETGPDEAEALLERLLADDAPRFSWGVAAYPDDGHHEDTLLDQADQRLLAQRAGRVVDLRSPARRATGAG